MQRLVNMITYIYPIRPDKLHSQISAGHILKVHVGDRNLHSCGNRQSTHARYTHAHTHTAYIGPKVLTNFINRQKLVIDASRDLAVSHCVSRLATLLDTLQLAALHSSKSYHVVYHVVEPHPLFLISPLNLGPGHLKFWQISFKQGDQGACGC